MKRTCFVKYSTVNCLISLGLEVVFRIICGSNYTEMYIKYITLKMIMIYFSIKVCFGHVEETARFTYLLGHLLRVLNYFYSGYWYM